MKLFQQQHIEVQYIYKFIGPSFFFSFFCNLGVVKVLKGNLEGNKIK